VGPSHRTPRHVGRCWKRIAYCKSYQPNLGPLIPDRRDPQAYWLLQFARGIHDDRRWESRIFKSCHGRSIAKYYVRGGTCVSAAEKALERIRKVKGRLDACH
jgi:hypothetical protein